MLIERVHFLLFTAYATEFIIVAIIIIFNNKGHFFFFCFPQFSKSHCGHRNDSGHHLYKLTLETFDLNVHFQPSSPGPAQHFLIEYNNNLHAGLKGKALYFPI